MWRYFSPANAPRSDQTIEFHVRAVDGGWVSPALVYSTGAGDLVRLAAPVGSGLVLDESSDDDLLLLAGGTGLAPLRALVEQLAGRRQRRNVDLYVGAHTEAELYDLPALRQLQERNRWLSVVPVVERGGSPGLAIGEPAQVALGHRRWHGAQVFVCGSPEMVQSSLQALASGGLDTRAVRRETYSYNGHVEHLETRREARSEPARERARP
jgi:NAD(P)H-flavin reductase